MLNLFRARLTFCLLVLLPAGLAAQAPQKRADSHVKCSIPRRIAAPWSAQVAAAFQQVEIWLSRHQPQRKSLLACRVSRCPASTLAKCRPNRTRWLPPLGKRLPDSNGDLADMYWVDVAKGRVPPDKDLFNLQNKCQLNRVRGTDREVALPLNFSLDQLVLLPPSNIPVSVLNHPQLIRMEPHSIPRSTTGQQNTNSQPLLLKIHASTDSA